ncbi:RNase J family beta-CASP ribonuclease [archaeon]|nr:RNase J family beta-CASP ribonuclease [archaeon]
MAVQICTVGGYSEVGKNMTAIKVDNEVVICDIGFYMPEIIKYEEEEGDKLAFDRQMLIKRGAAPNDRVIEDWKAQVRAIVFTHAHLDHIGALPYYAQEYRCPVFGTPYTIEMIRIIMKDEKLNIQNPLKVLNPNSEAKLSENIKIELINMTHSTPQTSMAAIHTKYGVIIYANDFKFDKTPIIGKAPDLKRLEELGKKGVLALIVDSLYSNTPIKTPSESVAREMLRDVMLGTTNKGNLIIVTTFASHIARLKSIVEFGKQLRRKIVFLGRSLHKYATAAENIKIINFSKDVEIIGYADKIKKKLKSIEKNRGEYLVVCTGNQGEPRSVLMKMVMGQYKFRFQVNDQVIFACRTIPCPINIENRKFLEKKLEAQGVRLFIDIHASGHAAREDLRDLIILTKPKHIIPAHGDEEKRKPMAELAESIGYKLGESVHLCSDGKIIDLK